MRVFVTGTGRCGTSTFYQACRHIPGFTAGHETKMGRIADWDYPDDHIEVASQLSIAIPILRERYPDAKWVHLIRDRDPCTNSLSRQTWEAMECFDKQWFVRWHPMDLPEVSEAFYDIINALCRATMPEHAMTIRIETAAEQWPAFCDYIGAPVVRESMDALQRIYNPAENRGRDNYR